jgi:PAS domain S-box-containing protein
MPHDQCPMALALKEQREIRDMEVVAERPDGTRVHVIPYPTPLYDASGTLIGAVNMLIDITDRKRADIHAQRLASFVESSDDAIVSKDLNGIITSWNGGAERLFGYSSEEVIGKPITILIPADRIDEEPEIIERVRRGERVDHYDTVRRRKDGSLIDISLTVSPLKDADGRIVGASKIARDITERKRAQEQQRLLVKEMKHRIKNSLATVQAIATQTLNQHAEERDAFIARLHALSNAHDLLTSETWQAASLQAIVTQALKPFREQHHERIAVEGPANVWLDATKSVVVAMVIHELATNALKYGALSNGSGYVSVKWKQHSRPSLVKLVLAGERGSRD